MGRIWEEYGNMGIMGIEKNLSKKKLPWRYRNVEYQRPENKKNKCFFQQTNIKILIDKIICAESSFAIQSEWVFTIFQRWCWKENTKIRKKKRKERRNKRKEKRNNFFLFPSGLQKKSFVIREGGNGGQWSLIRLFWKKLEKNENQYNLFSIFLPFLIIQKKKYVIFQWRKEKEKRTKQTICNRKRKWERKARWRDSGLPNILSKKKFIFLLTKDSPQDRSLTLILIRTFYQVKKVLWRKEKEKERRKERKKEIRS